MDYFFPPAEYLHHPINFILATDQGVKLALCRTFRIVNGELVQYLFIFVRILPPGRSGWHLGQRLLLQIVGQGMGDKLHHRHTSQSFRTQEIDGMRLGLRKDGNQYITAVHLFLTTALHMGHSPLQNAVKSHSLGRVSGGNCRQLPREERLQPLFQIVGRPPAFFDDILCQFIMQETIEHMLHGNILMMIALCLSNGPNQGYFQRFT